MPTISSVLVFANGMVAVCDERGQQMPDYQGTWLEKRAEILRDKPDSVQVEYQAQSRK